jgi:comEA protein
MKKALWNGLAACVAIVALVASPSVLAAKKKTPTPAAEASSASTAADGKASKTEKVNLNTADEKTIAGAKGVGDKLAQELVKSRPYKTWDDVSKVKGVGSGKKLDSLKKVLKLSEGVGAGEEKAAKGSEAESKSPSSKKSSSKGGETSSAASSGGAAGGGAAAGGAAASGSSGGTGSSAGAGKASASSEPSSPSKKSSSSSSSKLAPGTKININTATKEQLDALPEIGPVKAQAIVDYRNAHGSFASPEDIMKVSGIKEGTYAKIKDYIVVK